MFGFCCKYGKPEWTHRPMKFHCTELPSQFNQGIESWSEIWRTGYPLFLVKKGDIVWSGGVKGTQVSYSFLPEVGDEIPSRFIYPLRSKVPTGRAIERL